MSPPETWGPPIWRFFHTLAEKIKEDQYDKISLTLLSFIRRICSYLPCPDCSKHALHFLNQLKPENYKTKTDFKTLFYMLHNKVNYRKKKPLFNHSYLEQYSKMNLIHTYNRFISVYNTKGNMSLLTESFQRTLIIKDFKRWFLQNIHCFER
jgi:hypothetical protein